MPNSQHSQDRMIRQAAHAPAPGIASTENVVSPRVHFYALRRAALGRPAGAILRALPGQIVLTNLIPGVDYVDRGAADDGDVPSELNGDGSAKPAGQAEAELAAMEKARWESARQTMERDITPGERA